MSILNLPPSFHFIRVIVVITCVQLLQSCGGQVDLPSESGANSLTSEPKNRIVSLSGTITETLFATNQGDQIVGVDVTSTYPPHALAEVPRLGHTSQLNTEALLALKPTVVFVDADNTQAEPALAKIEAAGIKVARIRSNQFLSNSVHCAIAIAREIDLPEAQISILSQKIQRDSLALSSFLANGDQAPPRTLFLYARGPGRIMVGGKTTAANAMIEFAGGTNAAQVDNFANLTPESVVAANPEVLLLFESGLRSLDGATGLEKVPGLAATSAIINKRVVAMDGHYLLSFGPRAAQAALDLAKQLRGGDLTAKDQLSLAH